MCGEREPDATPVDIAGSLLARDYKGLNNYGFNAVIEKDDRD